jgi:hypothetical protein
MIELQIDIIAFFSNWQASPLTSPWPIGSGFNNIQELCRFNSKIGPNFRLNVELIFLIKRMIFLKQGVQRVDKDS